MDFQKFFTAGTKLEYGSLECVIQFAHDLAHRATDKSGSVMLPSLVFLLRMFGLVQMSIAPRSKPCIPSFAKLPCNPSFAKSIEFGILLCCFVSTILASCFHPVVVSL